MYKGKLIERVPNPHWPPINRPSLAGAAHGLRLPQEEREGVGQGRCFCVLQGGRSGGHQAAVLASVGDLSRPSLMGVRQGTYVRYRPFIPVFRLSLHLG
jgi:hypothetical protein